MKPILMKAKMLLFTLSNSFTSQAKSDTTNQKCFLSQARHPIHTKFSHSMLTDFTVDLHNAY